MSSPLLWVAQGQCSHASPVLQQKREAFLLGCSRGCRLIRAHLKGFSSPFFLPKASTVILEASCVKCAHRQQQLSQHISILLICSPWFFKWTWKMDCPYPVCSRFCTWGYCNRAHVTEHKRGEHLCSLHLMSHWQSVVEPSPNVLIHSPTAGVGTSLPNQASWARQTWPGYLIFFCNRIYASETLQQVFGLWKNT